MFSDFPGLLTDCRIYIHARLFRYYNRFLKKAVYFRILILHLTTEFYYKCHKKGARCFRVVTEKKVCFLRQRLG